MIRLVVIFICTHETSNPGERERDDQFEYSESVAISHDTLRKRLITSAFKLYFAEVEGNEHSEAVEAAEDAS